MRLLAIAALGAALLGAPIALAGSDFDSLPTDPRMIEANALLSDESQRSRAISLYESVLAEDPSHGPARMWAARVLSWDGRYDESIAHYDAFLAQPEPPEWAGVERAEVLSWAGRYDDAETAFGDLLRANPSDARAARGIARVYRWSGRENRALEAYRRALEIEDNAEASKEFALLRAKVGARTEATSNMIFDSDDYESASVRASGEVDYDLATRVVGSAGYTWVEASRDASDEGSVGRNDPDHAQAYDALIGLEHLFDIGGRSLRGRVELGGRAWTDADDAFLAKASAEFTYSERVSIGFQVDHGDFLERSQSLDAVLRGRRDTTLRASSWFGVLPQVGLFVYSEGTFIDDGNRRVAGGASLDYQPWSHLDLRLGLASSILTYVMHDDEDEYYDPSLSADGTLSLSGSIPLHEILSLSFRGGVGYGYAEQDGLDGDGLTYSYSGGPSVTVGSWWLHGRVSRSVSRRATSYKTWGGTIQIGRGF